MTYIDSKTENNKFYNEYIAYCYNKTQMTEQINISTQIRMSDLISQLLDIFTNSYEISYNIEYDNYYIFNKDNKIIFQLLPL